MVKNNFKALLFTTFIAVYFSNNLFAMQEIVGKQVAESPLLLSETEDAFIQEFSEKINDSMVEYDGETLRLYMDKSPNMRNPFIFMLASGFLGLGCSLKSVDRYGNRNNDLIDFGLLCLFLSAVSQIYILANVFSNSKLIPFLAINSEQIATRNNIKMKWADASIIKFLNDNSIMLCDKDGTPLFVIDNNNLPIKLSELIVILGFYFKKYGAKEKGLHA